MAQGMCITEGAMRHEISSARISVKPYCASASVNASIRPISGTAQFRAKARTATPKRPRSGAFKKPSATTRRAPGRRRRAASRTKVVLSGPGCVAGALDRDGAVEAGLRQAGVREVAGLEPGADALRLGQGTGLRDLAGHHRNPEDVQPGLGLGQPSRGCAHATSQVEDCGGDVGVETEAASDLTGHLGEHRVSVEGIEAPPPVAEVHVMRSAPGEVVWRGFLEVRLDTRGGSARRVSPESKELGASYWARLHTACPEPCACPSACG